MFCAQCHHDPVTQTDPVLAQPVVAAEEVEQRLRRNPKVDSLVVLVIVLVVAMVARPWLVPMFTGPAIASWATIFTAVCVQAIPFLVLGVTLSAAITAWVPSSFFERALPKRPAAAVPVAGLAGVILPGCECGSVPIAGGLVARGVPVSSAIAFLLSAPAINPIVLVATAVAFPRNPEMVLGRFCASLLLAVLVGYAWALWGKPAWVRMPPRPDLTGLSRPAAFATSARHDFISAGGFLVVGAATAATLQVVVPRAILDHVASAPVLSVLVLAVLAVVLAICSEADAFVAASLSQFSLTSRLVFLVVGPAVDVKLIALQAATFGRRFAVRLSSFTFVLAIGCAVLVGWVLL